VVSKLNYRKDTVFVAVTSPPLVVPFEIAEKISLERARMEEFEVAGGGSMGKVKLPKARIPRIRSQIGIMLCSCATN
jgi:hypothetical protein